MNNDKSEQGSYVVEFLYIENIYSLQLFKGILIW